MLEKLRDYYIEEGFRIISYYEDGNLVSFYIVDHFLNELVLRLSYENDGLEYIIKWYTSGKVNSVIFDEHPEFSKLKHVIDSYIR